jgi:hypothetical protein
LSTTATKHFTNEVPQELEAQANDIGMPSIMYQPLEEREEGIMDDDEIFCNSGNDDTMETIETTVNNMSIQKLEW